ncbi:rod-binding protein [Novosphingobium sp.]|uniref:rod-binding protein n=1 Tax=Novosphingobium sp. TaxID=1874826 RepID=UPI0025F5F375|nr:rod-binding protein [Novosphingobium sp.]
MTPISSPMLATGSLPASHGSNREQLAKAAQQFEAIFVRQMLAAARKSSFGGDVLGSQGLDTFRQMQDEHFADLAAQQGSFGLGRMIERHLAAQVSPLPPAGGAGGGPVGSTSNSRFQTHPPLTPPASGMGTLVAITPKGSD